MKFITTTSLWGKLGALAIAICSLNGQLKAQSMPVFEPDANNNTFATATPISGTQVKLRGNIFPAGDIDFYSFQAIAGDRVYIAAMTAFSAGNSTDGQLTLLASDGTTTIEFDDDNGSSAGLSSTIAGATIPATGTYYIKYNDFTAGTASERGYDLYLRVQSGSPMLESESNDTPATADTLPANGWVSGARGVAAATEQDWYAFNLQAGESVYLSLDVDPERDGTVWNGRLGLALFGDAGNQILVVDDAGTGDVAPLPNIPSEAIFFTVKTAGIYYAFVDCASAAVGGPTATYNLSVTKYAAQQGYFNYASANVPVTIGPANGIFTSTLTIPDNKIIKDLKVNLDLNHALMQDLDVTLTAPNGKTIMLFTDIGAAATGGQQQMNTSFDDYNSTIPMFTVMKGICYTPELASKLDQFLGLPTAGTWTLTIYDDANNANGGTLNNWSLDVLEDSVPITISSAYYDTIFHSDFEATNGGFIHSGTADEFEWGTPATLPTTTANPIAGFTTAHSGTNCWKTDLDNTYDANSDQTLESPDINLTGLSGTTYIKWWMQQQMENATFDQLTVYVEEVGAPANMKELYNWMGATQVTSTTGNPTVNIGMSGGWVLKTADISSFAGKTVRFKVRVRTDGTNVFGGVAIDDITVVNRPPCVPTAATFNQTACHSYVWNSNTYYASGTYVNTILNAGGCDSVMTLNLTINPIDTTMAAPVSICQGDSVDFYGTYLQTAGTFYHTLTSAVSGCDSVRSIDVNILMPTTGSVMISGCDSASVNGTTYYADGAYTQTLINAAGCDSILSVDVVLTHSTSAILSLSDCDTVTVNGIDYTATGTYTQHLTNMAGCDSVLTVNVTINSNTSSLSVSGCDSVLVNTIPYFTTGVYTQTLTNAAGCDSVITVNATITYSTSSNLNIAGCDSVTYNGITYYTSGPYTQVLINAAGCDSVVSLFVTIDALDTGVTLSPASVLTADQAGALYQWIDCSDNSEVTGETSQSFTPVLPGDYAVVITMGSCSDTSACTTVNLIGVKELKAEHSLNVYPNPNNGSFTVKARTEGEYTIANELGQVVSSFKLTASNNYSVKLEALSNGVYFITGTNNNEVTRLKVVVTK